MARFYQIEKDGIKTAVDEFQFEAIYKPKGWKIISTFGESAETVKTNKDEQAVKNKERMKRASAKKKFDDNLIKGE